MAKRKNRRQAKPSTLTENEGSRRRVMKEKLGGEFCNAWSPLQQRHGDKKKDLSRKACRKFKHEQRDI